MVQITGNSRENVRELTIKMEKKTKQKRYIVHIKIITLIVSLTFR